MLWPSLFAQLGTSGGEFVFARRAATEDGLTTTVHAAIIYTLWTSLLTVVMPPLIAVVAWALSKLRRMRSVLWVMDVYPEIATAYGVLQRTSLLHRLFARLNAVLYRDAIAVISPGEMTMQPLAAAGVPPERLHTVHNWTLGEAVAAEEEPAEEPLAFSS